MAAAVVAPVVGQAEASASWAAAAAVVPDLVASVPVQAAAVVLVRDPEHCWNQSWIARQRLLVRLCSVVRWRNQVLGTQRQRVRHGVCGGEMREKSLATPTEEVLDGAFQVGQEVIDYRDVVA